MVKNRDRLIKEKARQLQKELRVREKGLIVLEAYAGRADAKKAIDDAQNACFITDQEEELPGVYLDFRRGKKKK